MKISPLAPTALVAMSSLLVCARGFSSRFAPRSRRGLAAAAAAAAVDNPLLQQEGLPKFESIQPKDLTPAVESLLEKMSGEFKSFESKLEQVTSEGDVSINYDEVLPEVERIQFGLGYTWGVAGHLNGVANGDELREAYESNQPKVVQAMTTFSQSKPLYDALTAIEKQWGQTEVDVDVDVEALTFEEKQRRRAVENSLRGMRNGGVGLEGEKKERFNEIRMKLASLATTFSNHVLDDTKAFSLTIEDPKQLEGVPESAKGQWAQSHANFVKSQTEEPEIDPAVGPYRITLDMPSYLPALLHIPDRSIREKLYRANIQRASEANPDNNNVPLIYEILKLKSEMANLLGYDNYAELSLASKMAPSVQSVADLSELIAERAIPAAQRELAEVTELARKEGGPEYSEENLEKLAPWDVTFWSERLKESKFDLTDEQLRPYFALPAVLDGLFGLVDRIFDIEIKAADGEAEVWNKDVRFFNVYDKSSGDHIASFFLDPYSRPENKRGGAWMDVCIGKSEAVNRDIPVAYLTCNGSPPVGDRPSLMTFNEVSTLFHEAGHGFQHMLTRASVGDVAGINGVEWDAVELPSQFMEEFCYDRATVYGFAKHWETGEPLPEEFFKKICEQKTFNSGMMSCRQLYFGQMDMELHSNFDATAGESGEGETIFDVQKRIASKYTPHSTPLDEDRFLCAFNHIFAGGYSAGYYSYKWAEVLSSDCFSAFEEVGLENEEEVRKIGKKFRDTVLSLGGGVEPMQVFKEFRGREPSPDALLRHSGFA